MERIILTASDSLHIAGDYTPGTGSCGALFIHMMPAAKESWRELAARVAEKGLHALAIDLRGHGESDGGPDGYTRFSDAEQQACRLDVDAGAEFLKTKGVKPESLAVIGASIGANLSLEYLALHPVVRTAVLLSAGLNYYGIETLPFVRRLRAGARVFFAGSEDDGRRSGANCGAMARMLHENVPVGVEKKLIVYQHAGHGTDMLGKEKPDLGDAIVSWVEGG